MGRDSSRNSEIPSFEHLGCNRQHRTVTIFVQIMQDETTLTSRVNTREIIQILSARKYIHLAAANSEASTELNQGL